MNGEVFEKLLISIRTTDSYVLFWAFLAMVFGVASCIFARSVEKRTSAWYVEKNIEFAKYLNGFLNICYSLFLTIVSLFPLLGMFGTVKALLGLDLSVGEINNVKNSFFDALTSTAWGIIFSVFFKIVNALFENYIGKQIENSERLSEDLKTAKKRK